MFAVYGLHFNPGTETVNYIFNIRSSEAINDNRNHYNKTDGEVHLLPGAAQYKWTVVHEMGHAFQDKNTTNDWMAFADYSINSTLPCNSPPDPVTGYDTHGIHSKEYVTTAFGEGFAHFYGAAAFNSMDEPDSCWSDNPIDPWNCAFGQPNSPQPFMEDKCTRTFDGMGVEVDWLRTLWGVRTGGTMNSPQPTTTNEILDWFDTADAFTRDNAYEVLNQSAITIGGRLKINWDYFKQLNGIMH